MRAVFLVAVAMAGVVGGTLTALAQSSDTPRRNPPRVIITPKQPAADPYPKAGAAFPGPGYVRDCVAFYVEDPRPSGTVIVPRQRCQWVRGHS
jgi:hypothetical protein